MKAFFEGMSFVRGAMLLCFVVAAGLGYMVNQERAEVAVLKDQVHRQAGFLTNEIQKTAVQLDLLRKVESGSEFQAIEQPKQYIDGIARERSVAIGLLDFGNVRTKSFAPGTEDKILHFGPALKDRAFSRAQISNLFYMMERKSPFAKVTKLEFRLQKKSKPEEHPVDRWTFSGDMTIRQPKASAQ